MPRLLVVNPNTTASMTAAIGAIARDAARSGTEIVARNPLRGPKAIEGPEDREACIGPLLAEIVSGERDGCDATVIACFDDPGVDVARAAVHGPVIGLAEAAMRAASGVAPRWAIVTTVEPAVQGLEALVARYGMQRRCAGVFAARVPVLALEDPDAATRERVLETTRAAMREGGVGAILLGCAGMSTLHGAIESEAGVPAVDGVRAAVRHLEDLLASRRTA